MVMNTSRTEVISGATHLYVRPVLDKGKYVAFIDGMLALFPKETIVEDKEYEVMITGLMYHTDEKGYRDYARPKFLFIRPVTDEYTLVSHRGFECSGSMCRTLASCDAGGWLSPGRVGVRYVDNVNWKHHAEGERPKYPSHAWVLDDDIKDSGTFRIEGISDINEMEFKHLGASK